MAKNKRTVWIEVVVVWRWIEYSRKNICSHAVIRL